MKKYNLLEDIVIFGSFVREKTSPKDIDIAFLVHKKDEHTLEKIELEIKKLIELKIDTITLTIKDVYSPVWLSIILEGWSVRQGEFLPVLYGTRAKILYKYSIKMLNPVQKVQFDRGLKKLLEDLEGIRLIRTIVLIPLQKSEQFEEFLQTWKIEFETQRYTLLPEYQKSAKLLA